MRNRLAPEPRGFVRSRNENPAGHQPAPSSTTVDQRARQVNLINRIAELYLPDRAVGPPARSAERTTTILFRPTRRQADDNRVPAPTFATHPRQDAVSSASCWSEGDRRRWATSGYAPVGGMTPDMAALRRAIPGPARSDGAGQRPAGRPPADPERDPVLRPELELPVSDAARRLRHGGPQRRGHGSRARSAPQHVQCTFDVVEAGPRRSSETAPPGRCCRTSCSFERRVLLGGDLARAAFTSRRT